MMKADPQKEHQWLHKLVGTWSCEAECSMGPDQPPAKMKATESVRSLGGLWVIAEGEGEMPGGGTGTTRMTLGYDPQKRRYVGTWVGSMMTNMWIYEGSLDATGTVLTLDTEGPSFAGDGQTSKYQDVIAFENDDHRVLTSRVLRADGTWNAFMTAHYRRQK